MRMLPEDCVDGQWSAAFDTLNECVTFFLDSEATTDPGTTPGDVTDVAHNDGVPDWLNQLKADIKELGDNTKVQILVNMTVVW